MTEIIGDDKKVTGVKVNNNKTGEDSEIAVDGVFIYVGINPITKPFSNLGITDENGWIETNDHMETKVPGIFAVGDVRKKDLRQVATAVGEGGTAGQGVYTYITALGDKVNN